MKAVGYSQPLPITDANALLDVELPEPQTQGRDLLVRVKAVSVNPVDTKVRRNKAPAAGETRILGWDAAGVVEQVGSEVTLFRPGDEVWYAGTITRPGTNMELHLVDERLVGRKPQSLDDAHAAALPLTTLTAWELLFERLAVVPGKAERGESLLIVGAGGGVGSILTQLAKRLTAMTVIATASRKETVAWVEELGADHIIDHAQPLSRELKRIGVNQVTHVAGLTQTARHFTEIVESLAPQGRLGLIDDPSQLDITLLKPKSLSLHWELMFTRAMFETPDMISQHRILNEASALVDAGVLRTTLAEHYGRINAENLKRAHSLLEAGKSRGKIVLEGF